MRPSAGTAGVLGLEKLNMETPPTCAYFLIGERCPHSCLFCSQRSGTDQDRNVPDMSRRLSRITWKPENDESVLSALKEKVQQGGIGRVCLQSVAGAYGETMEQLVKIRKISDVPVCISINGISYDEILDLIHTGADKIAFSFDAVTPELFERIKARPWQELWDLFVRTVENFPGRVVIHLIAGLGETEKSAVSAIEMFYSFDVDVSLFAFTPLPGTPLARRKPPELSSYRRVQTALYLIRIGNRNSACGDPFYSFEEERLVFEPSLREELSGILDSSAFQTYGCTYCNRPLYNERPGQVPYNYPRPLSPEEMKSAIDEIFR